MTPTPVCCCYKQILENKKCFSRFGKTLINPFVSEAETRRLIYMWIILNAISYLDEYIWRRNVSLDLTNTSTSGLGGGGTRVTYFAEEGVFF